MQSQKFQRLLAWAAQTTSISLVSNAQQSQDRRSAEQARERPVFVAVGGDYNQEEPLHDHLNPQADPWQQPYSAVSMCEW